MHEKFQQALKWLKYSYALDTRMLAVFRICLALLLLYDLAIRAGDVEAFYTDAGVLPLEALHGGRWAAGNWSFMSLSGELWWQWMVAGATAAVYLMLLVGWKTRLATVLAFVMLSSLINRNHYINQGGDQLLRMMVFWGIFLPLNYYHALDTKRLRERARYIFTPAGLAFFIQVGAVYFFSALLKRSGEWVVQGTALYYALSLDSMVLHLGKLLHPYFMATKWMTHYAYWLEALVGLLLFISLPRHANRWLFVFLVATFHLGIGVTLFVGLFYIIGWVSLIPFGFFRSQNEIGKPILTYSILPGWGRYAEYGIVLVLVSFILGFNFGDTTYTRYALHPGLKRIGHAGGIAQNWGMFSPNVFKADGWYVFKGITLDEKEEIDISRDGVPISYTKPEYAVGWYKNDRWRKFYENHYLSTPATLRKDHCEWALATWNRNNPDRQIHRLDVVYILEMTRPRYLLSPQEPQVCFTCMDQERSPFIKRMHKAYEEHLREIKAQADSAAAAERDTAPLPTEPPEQ